MEHEEVRPRDTCRGGFLRLATAEWPAAARS